MTAMPSLDDISWGAPVPDEKKEISLNTLINRMKVAFDTVSGESITPDNCMRSPTVQAVVTAISRRIAISPVSVFRKGVGINGRETKEKLPNHSVAKLLRKPNNWQTRVDYWLDATSALVRYGRYFAWKGQGQTGPIRRLVPLEVPDVQIVMSEDRDITFRLTGSRVETIEPNRMHYVRGPARDFISGDSPIMDIREAIATEIAAEKFSAAFFGNGAMPLIFFKFMQDSKGFGSDDAEREFIETFQEAYSGKKRFKGLVMPVGMEADATAFDNEKTQLNETRQNLQTIIAGAFGVPPHLVGNLTRSTFNNVEQQDKDFTINVVLPYVQMFEASMERDLLTDSDLRDNICIRFNLDAVQRADFKSRQEGLAMQRTQGVINANEWREIENLNPISEDDGGEEYIRPMNMTAGEDERPTETEETTEGDENE